LKINNNKVVAGTLPISMIEDLQNQYPALQELGVEVYSVSTDTHFTHKAWHDTSDTIRKVQYPLVVATPGTCPMSSSVAWGF
jgi:peroxiredoxin